MKMFTALVEKGELCVSASVPDETAEQALAFLRAAYPSLRIICLHEGWTHETQDLLKCLGRRCSSSGQ